jgi:isorenieratene synthase
MIVLGKRSLSRADPPAPAWTECKPRWIANALAAAQTRGTGGWFVIDASHRIVQRPSRFVIAGEALVVFRDRDDRIVAGPDRCPHLGARLSDGRLDDGHVVCPWHGLRLGGKACGTWRPLPTHDDGVLAWVRLGAADEVARDRPVLPERPLRFVAGVLRLEVRCDPRDVIANRLDPWHGPHLHGYRFTHVRVLELGEDRVVVRVHTRIAGRIAVEVDARFHILDRRTIVMTIVSGMGEGSVVETHATPIAPGRTAIVEASLASSRRLGFALAPLARVVRPWLERAARRLWVEDAPYAERLYELREGP